MLRTQAVLIAIAAATLAGPALAEGPKPGIYASSRGGCVAVRKADPKGRLIFEDLMDRVLSKTDGNFLEVDSKSVGSFDFSCAIGKPRKRGKATEWSLACAGESSGGARSRMRQSAPGKLTFSGGLAEWGTVRFCR